MLLPVHLTYVNLNISCNTFTTIVIFDQISTGPMGLHLIIIITVAVIE